VVKVDETSKSHKYLRIKTVVFIFVLHRKLMDYHSKYSVCCRVGLTQLVRFLVVELIQPDSNVIFDVGVVFKANYSFSRRRRPHRQRYTLVN
jgi:hypothetical protein